LSGVQQLINFSITKFCYAQQLTILNLKLLCFSYKQITWSTKRKN